MKKTTLHLDVSIPRTSVESDLRWALVTLDLVSNGLRNRRKLGDSDVEMFNLQSARNTLLGALDAYRGEQEYLSWH